MSDSDQVNLRLNLREENMHIQTQSLHDDVVDRRTFRQILLTFLSLS